MVILGLWPTKGNGFGKICNMDKNSRKIILRHDDTVSSAFQDRISENCKRWK